MSKAITLLGSTGSIGTQSLDVIKKQGYTVFALAAYSNTALLMRQIDEFSPKFVAMVDDNAANELSAQLNKMQNPPELLRGEDGVARLAGMKEADIVLNAVVGIAGLKATLTALNKGIDVALANKESLVTGGNLVIDAAKKSGAKLLPVDSEHSAIFQCLQDKFSAPSLNKILLTASGGPFFGKTKDELQLVKKEDALRHPNWSMGNKITIDSATLMNKGLELIEAVWLFGLDCDKIEIVVQRQSVIHSMVQFTDNSI
ncbi:MAG: 1-deoxy-D-xylulose-5-phosphate reductoisomerase, partial [Oscillospiraceae bacterium]